MQSHAASTRRGVLRTVGLGVAGLAVAGNVRASEERYIVGTSSRAGRREAQQRASHVYRVLDFGRYGSAVAGRFSERALRGLSRRPDVRYVEPDGLMHAIAIDSGDGEVPWGVDRVDAETVHAAGLTGGEASVAVIDTGIDHDHPDLQANVAGGISYTVGPWWRDDSSTDPKDWDDGNGHGTHCAGTIGAVDDGSGVVGVAPDASLYAVKVLDDSGSGSWSDVAAGIAWAGDNGMHVASMSLGGGYSQTVEDACAYAAGKDVLLVAAAGNDGEGTADDHYPGASQHVMAVGATDDTDAVASFSSTGSVVEMSAPGVAVPSTWKGGGYNTISGTSMACPHVSGGGALLRAQGLSAADARTRLGSTAEDLGASGRDVEYGYGLFDAEAATGVSGGSDGGSEDTTAPSISDASATDDADGDGTVAGGDQITVSTTVTDSGTGVASVSADASAFGGSSTLSLSNGGSGDAYTATFQVDATSTTDGTYAITVTATDGAATPNTASADTNTLTLDTSGGDTGGSDTTDPSVDTLTASEAGSPNPKAEVTPTAEVSDDTKLASVRFELLDGTAVLDRDEVAAGGTIDTVSGYLEAGSGRNRMDGKTLTVRAVAVDAAGNESAVTETTVTA